MKFPRSFSLFLISEYILLISVIYFRTLEMVLKNRTVMNRRKRRNFTSSFKTMVVLEARRLMRIMNIGAVGHRNSFGLTNRTSRPFGMYCRISGACPTGPEWPYALHRPGDRGSAPANICRLHGPLWSEWRHGWTVLRWLGAR